MKTKLNKNFAIWITGLPGSGKTSIGKLFYTKFKNNYGPTLFFNGDDIRNIFKIKKFDLNSRKIIAKQYSMFIRFIVKQNVNIIFTCVAMFDEVRKFNRINIPNYVEIFIDTKINKIIAEKKKKLYLKQRKNMIGIDLMAELPKKPDIKIKNDFSKSTKELSDQIYLNFLKKFK
tara:strand:- start:4826 stop:5347 length:522 start_codon:yes stop_codon:yes gene_type:complete